MNATVVSALGGLTTPAVMGGQQVDLGWLPVFLKTSAVVMAVSLIIATITARTRSGARTEAGGGSIPSWNDSFWRSVKAITFPWRFSAVWLAIWFLAPLVFTQSGLSFLVTITPLCLAMIAAGSLSGVVGAFGGSARSPSKSEREKSWCPELAVVFVAACLWEAASFWMNERLYAGLLVPHGDSAMYEEHLWNVWHGKGFRSYLDQGLFLGEHIQVIHLLLLPLHMLWPSYLMMELCASISLAICVVPIFSIAQRHSGSSRAAMWLSMAWLLYFPMHFLDIAIDFKTLRPSCYGMPFLFWGIDFAERRKLLHSAVCLLIALSTQEDFALITGPIGFVLFLRSRNEAISPERRRFRIWSLSVLAFSVAWLLLAVLVVIPAFRGGEVVHYSRYFGELGSSPGELIRTALRSPGSVFSVLVSFRTLFYVLVLTVPLGLRPLFRPTYLLAGAATFVMLSLIQLGNEPTSGAASVSQPTLSQLPPIPYHHFHAPLLPVIFWAAAAALNPVVVSAAADRRKSRWEFMRSRCWPHFPCATSRARFACFCALATALTGSMMPVGVSFWARKSLYVPGERATEFPKVLAQLPPSSRVASTDYVHTRLTHFDRSYDYSDYLRAVNNYQPGVPADTDFIVIDTSHPYSRVRKLSNVRELNVEPEKWDVLPDSTKGLFIILKRRRSPGSP
jgi:uncharacterized membrane protein